MQCRFCTDSSALTSYGSYPSSSSSSDSRLPSINPASASLNSTWISSMLWIFAAERKSLISSLLARCSSVSFLRFLLIIKTSEVVSLLLYTTSEVYTNFRIDSGLTQQIIMIKIITFYLMNFIVPSAFSI